MLTKMVSGLPEAMRSFKLNLSYLLLFNDDTNWPMEKNWDCPSGNPASGKIILQPISIQFCACKGPQVQWIWTDVSYVSTHTTCAIYEHIYESDLLTETTCYELSDAMKMSKYVFFIFLIFKLYKQLICSSAMYASENSASMTSWWTCNGLSTVAHQAIT